MTSTSKFSDVVKQLTPEIYQRFKTAVETGQWPDGSEVTVQQKEICMDAIIHYESYYVDKAQRVGFIDRSKKESTGCGSAAADSAPKPVNWLN